MFMGKAARAKGPADLTTAGQPAAGAPAGYTKIETVWLVGFVALILGFVAGVAFSVYKQEATTAALTQQPLPQGQMPQGQPQADIAARIPELVQQAAGHPDEPIHWIELGNAYYDTDQPQKAVEAYEKALALKPDNPDVWTDMGVMYRKNGQPQKAIEAFDKAIAIDKGHGIAHFNKGVVLMHDLNNSAGAIAAWEQLLAVNPQAKAPGGQPLKDLLERLKAPPEK